VVLVARTGEALEEVRLEIEAEDGIAHVHPCDLRDPDAVEHLIAQVVDAHGSVDVLVNNAGHSIRRSINDSYDRLHDFERVMRLNYLAPLQLILGLIPGMRERGAGHIVNVSTMGVFIQGPRFSAYIASKAALDAFSNSLATESRHEGIRVTSIHPALVRTPMVVPTAAYADAPALTAEETADTIAEAIRTRPPRMVPRLGRVFALVRLIAPRVVERRLNAKFRSSAAAGLPPESGDLANSSRAGYL
jgi:short-subunit dehydrogenase